MWRGSFSALPFDDNNDLNFAASERLSDSLKGVNARKIIVIFPDSILAQHDRYDFVDFQHAFDMHQEFVRRVAEFFSGELVIDFSQHLIAKHQKPQMERKFSHK